MHGLDAIDRAAELGFRGIHLDLADLVRDGRRAGTEEVTGRCAAAGVAVVALGINLLNAIGLRRDPSAARRAVRDAVECAIALGVPTVHLPAFRAAAITSREDLERSAELLRFAGDLAHGSEVSIATENALSADACANLLEAVGRDDVLVLFDGLNQVVEGHDPLATLDRLGDRLAEVAHVKDGTSGRKGDARIGSGVGRVAATLDRLLGLPGPWTLVLENDYSSDAAARTAADLAALRRIAGTHRV